MKTRLAISSSALVFSLLTGCETAGLGALTNAQCLKETDIHSQDACYFDLVYTAADNNDLETCLSEIYMIQDPLMRAAATRMVISKQPQGMEIITASNLCQQLTEDEADDCDRTWNRPHLWVGK